MSAAAFRIEFAALLRKHGAELKVESDFWWYNREELHVDGDGWQIDLIDEADNINALRPPHPALDDHVQHVKDKP